MAAFLQSFADALNVSEAEGRKALEGFAARLRARVRDEGQVTLGGLGTFSEAGQQLAFTPDESVALVVNHRYAGMEPIALSGGAPPTWQQGTPDHAHPLGAPPAEVFEDVPFEEAEVAPPPAEEVTPELPEVPDASETPTPEAEETAPEMAAPEVEAPAAEEEAPAWADVPPPTAGADLPPLFASDETLMALRDAAREMADSPPSADADEWAARMIEEEGDAETETPEAEAPEASMPPPPLAPESVPVEAHVEMPPDFEEEPEEVEEEELVPRLFPSAALPEEEPEPVEETPPPVLPFPVAPPAPAPAAEGPPAPPRRPAPAPEPERRFPWLPAVLLLALVAVVVAVLLMREPEAPAVTPAAPPVAMADSVQAPDTSAAALAAETTATPEPEAPAAAEPETALRGTTPVTAGRGYTLVVGGGTQAQAEGLVAPLRARGYRTGVLAGRTDAGAPIYRAAVGQFGSVGEAQSALRRESGLPAGTWILNLRSPLVRAE